MTRVGTRHGAQLRLRDHFLSDGRMRARIEARVAYVFATYHPGVTPTTAEWQDRPGEGFTAYVIEGVES